MKQLINTVWMGVAAAVAITIFNHWGGFTLAASVLLGTCFTIVAVWVYSIYQIVAFKPYSLQFFVNFEALQQDLGMVKVSKPSDQEEIPHELYNFTAISAALFVHYREYVYRTANELNLSGRSTRTDDEFRSAIQFGGTIPGILNLPTDWGNPNTRIFWPPRFLVSWNRTGFELQIRVVPEWWSQYKKHLSSDLRNLPVTYDGCMVLARLPYGYIPDHVRRYYETVSLFYPFDRLQRRWKSRLSKHGWTVTEPDEEISSRYLIVRYRGIWPQS